MIDSTTKDMISVWMGTSFKTPNEFNEYTDGMEDSDSHCPAFQILEFHLLILIILWHSRQIMEKLCQLKC